MSKLSISLLVGAVAVLIGLSLVAKPKRPTTLIEQTRDQLSSTIQTSTTAVPLRFDEPLPSSKKKVIRDVQLTRFNTIPIIGPIGPEATNIAQAITQASQHNGEVYVVINSPGGSVLDGALVVSAIQASSAHINTICLAFCASMGSIIFESGHTRMMVDRSFLLFHPASGGVEGSFPQMESRFRFFNLFVDKMDLEIATRAGLTLQDFKTRLNNEWILDAEDAQKNHLNDELVNVVFNFQGENQDSPNSLTKQLLHSQTKIVQDTFHIGVGK